MTRSLSSELHEPQSIGVVHLVRAANGVEPFRAFLKSYRRYPAGVPHTLVLTFKGFGGDLPEEYEAELIATPHQRHFVPDIGFDVDLYFSLVRDTEFETFCFLKLIQRDTGRRLAQEVVRAAATPRRRPCRRHGFLAKHYGLHH